MGKGGGGGIDCAVAKGQGGVGGARVKGPGKGRTATESVIGYFRSVEGDGDVVTGMGNIDAV